MNQTIFGCYLQTLVLFLVAITHAVRISYDGYKVYQVTPRTRVEADLLREFEEDIHFDFWSEIRAVDFPVDIMVAPGAQEEFEDFLDNQNLEYTTIIENVEEKIQEEDSRQRRQVRVDRGNVTFTEYMRHDEILAYIEQLTVDYPSIATTEVIGKSFEGRDLTVIRISSGASNKSIIFIEAAIHAREWIAPPVALYIINQLVENSNYTNMYEDIEWVIFPVVNPDGYEYTHTDARLWRKTRSTATICNGVDGNRNFDFQWMVTGASSWQCSETYAGRSAFSEVETQAVKNFFDSHRGRIKLFIDLHSYGRLLMFPWGYTSDPPSDFEELQSLGERVNDAITSVRGTNYTVGTAISILYPTSGGSRDYAKAVGGIDLSYTIELPAGGNAGFNPDASEIIPVVTEIWEGIKVFYDYVVEKYVNGTKTV
ncbi:hypothetical protein NQ315_004046 [Exocentrus adspersus]|uniref:Zinc carboxypeptidase A 1 n=1 Tax=Exocentrus adspersus TaxID=1586481 RepID=A0AAV8W686_9CUCU|nr:hypothetical protein NQ315_004046 [Exocentrus adspersus]